MRTKKLLPVDLPEATRYSEDTTWVLDTLRTCLHLLGRTNREVEAKLGWSHGYLSRLFSGAIQLRMEQLLAIVDVIDLKPGEFFDLAFPLPAPPSEAAAKLCRLLRRYGARPAVFSDPERGRHLVGTLREVTHELENALAG